jgi:hypothetical protein
MRNSAQDIILEEIFEICELHLKRMQFAKTKVKQFLPISGDNYYTLGEDCISFLDQYIFRFSKLQDTMGARLFPVLLASLAEPMEDKPFIDLLNRLERLEIIDSTLGWIQLRKIRNDIAHEYPTSLSERLEGINILFDHLEYLQQIIKKCRKIIE